MKLFGRTPQVPLANDPQSHRLIAAMNQQALSHGDEARVDLKHLRVGARGVENLQPDGAYFCEISGLDVRAVVKTGDGGSLPNKVVLKGLRVNSLGYYDLKNALIRSNGRIEVIVDRHTEVVAAEPVH